jgi:hypothetical protein
MSSAAYVLQDFGREDGAVVEEMIGAATAAVETFLRDGVDLAMSRHNGPLVTSGE